VVLYDLNRVAPAQQQGILVMTDHEKIIDNWKKQINKQIIKAKIKVQNLSSALVEEEENIKTLKSLSENVRDI
jgi:uncharacterized protein YegL|tara:strand:+ start:1012 stop:1230 length:219 start_codon:yes stop_codon:yes gene_type:complete